MGVFLTNGSIFDFVAPNRSAFESKNHKDKPKRDPRAFDLIQQFLPALMLDTMIKMVVTVLLSKACFQNVPEFAHVSYVSRHVTSKVETVTNSLNISVQLPINHIF